MRRDWRFDKDEPIGPDWLYYLLIAVGAIAGGMLATMLWGPS